ncbi:MAG: beta-lactamase domain protein [Fibrobacteres bacterium]|nr:beta-lactamase domain protein [Fibrobacterota bacterium]
MKITFLGAAGTVTGSRYLIEFSGRRILVDCGLFQGLKSLRLRNRERFPIAPSSVDAVLLTHAHLDHSGYLPRLVFEGFKGPIYCSSATRDLSRILLLDSAHIQEEEAEHARGHGYSKHAHPEPLYTVAAAEQTLRQFESVAWAEPLALNGGLKATFLRAGHILGASMIHLRHERVTATFSGDLGRPRDPMMAPPSPLPPSDYLVIESTYGDRKHEDVDPAAELDGLISRAKGNGGVILIPSFAVGRTQSLLFQLWSLKKAGRLQGLPVFVDSPMASDVTDLYLKHPSDHRLDPQQCREVFGIAHYVRTADESKALSARKGPMILISASGMITGGRILHHLRAFGGDPSNAIALAGYQAEGTRGAQLAQGAESIKIFGEYVPIRAKVARLPNESAHADADEMLAWLRLAARPIRTYITHGDPPASAALAERIGKELGWDCTVPEQLGAYEWNRPVIRN